MSKKLPYLLPSILFFLAAPVAWILCFREVPLKISPQTTYLTEPKTADGLCVDYFAAIKEQFEPKCKPEENGFRMIVQALGKSPYFDEPDWYWESLCRELELDPTLLPTLKFEPARAFFNREYLLWLDENEPPPDAVADTEKLNEAMKSEPWTAEEYPFMVRWVEENSPLLDLVAEALRQKHYFVPMLRAPAEKGTIGLPASFHAELTLPHQIIDAFFYRLQYRLGKNDIDGAWRDAAGIARLRIYQHAMIPGKFTYPFDHVLREEELTPEQQEYFLAELNSLPERDSVRETLAICRLKTLWEDAVMASRNSPSFRSLNWNLIAAETNRLYDQLEQAWQQIEKEPARRQQIVDDLQKRLTTKPERSMLEKWLGKPLTVSGRSREFAWARNEFLGQGLVHVLLESDEKALDELRERIEPKKQKPEGSAAH